MIYKFRHRDHPIPFSEIQEAANSLDPYPDKRLSTKDGKFQLSRDPPFPP